MPAPRPARTPSPRSRPGATGSKDDLAQATARHEAIRLATRIQELILEDKQNQQALAQIVKTLRQEQYVTERSKLHNQLPVIVIGHRRDIPDPGFPEGRSERSEWTTLRQVIGGLPLPGTLPGNRIHTLHDGTMNPGPFRSDELHVERGYSELSRARFREIPYGGNRFDLPEDLKCEAWKKHTSGSGDVMGRLRWDEPSVTIRTEFNKPEKGRYLHPVHHRAISPHEGARIQGFPDDYRFVGPITQIVKQIGNAVPVPLGRAIGEHLAPLLAGGSPRPPRPTSPGDRP